MGPIVQTVTLVAAVANGIALSQTKGAAGTLTLNGSLVTGGIATLDSGGAARRVIVTSAGDDSGITFTITGTGRNAGNPTGPGVAQTEVLQGANGVATSALDFLTVTQIANSAATAAAVTAGTSGFGSGPWIPLDNFGPPMTASLTAYVLSGGPTYQIDETYDDVFGTSLPAGVVYPRSFIMASMANKTISAAGLIPAGDVPRAVRLMLVDVGSVQLSVLQQSRL